MTKPVCAIPRSMDTFTSLPQRDSGSEKPLMVFATPREFELGPGSSISRIQLPGPGGLPPLTFFFFFLNVSSRRVHMCVTPPPLPGGAVLHLPRGLPRGRPASPVGSERSKRHVCMVPCDARGTY